MKITISKNDIKDALNKARANYENTTEQMNKLRDENEQSRKQRDERITELQKQLDLEAEATIGKILSDSLVIRESEELQKAFRKYGLTINIQ